MKTALTVMTVAFLAVCMVAVVYLVVNGNGSQPVTDKLSVSVKMPSVAGAAAPVNGGGHE